MSPQTCLGAKAGLCQGFLLGFLSDLSSEGLAGVFASMGQERMLMDLVWLVLWRVVASGQAVYAMLASGSTPLFPQPVP